MRGQAKRRAENERKGMFGKMANGRDEYRVSRILYITEAALEYFISIAVGSVYLAKLAEYIGFSDSLTGILSAFVSLGCGFQIIAIFLAHRKPVKKWVTVLHILSQSLFSLLYLVPVTGIPSSAKAVVFVLLLLVAYIIHNIVNAPKTTWYMSLVRNEKRGAFTANKEIVSLLGGVIFSWALGAMTDAFERRGNIRGAFLTGGIVLFVLMVLHSATLIFSKEKPEKAGAPVPVSAEVKALFSDKSFLKISAIAVIWNVANYVTVPFLGTYQTKELGFSMTFASVIIMSGSLLRAVCSRPLGKFADQFSFADMLVICFVIEALAFGVNVFTVPSNGRVVYTVHYLLYVAGMAGINGSVINLIYDYVAEERRTSALALQQTLAGLSGFLTTTLVSPLVGYIQKSEGKFFGLTIYAQQILSFVSFLLTVFLIIYMLTVVKRIRQRQKADGFAGRDLRARRDRRG